MTAEEYLKENSDWFDKSPGGEKLYFESEVIRMMVNYAETYGCKGSDEPNGKKVLSALKDFRDSLTEEEKETMFKGSDDHIVDTNKMVSSQTEISDEEIEEAAKNAWSDYVFDEGNLYYTTFKGGWEYAIKWYREQLKQK